MGRKRKTLHAAYSSPGPVGAPLTQVPRFAYGRSVRALGGGPRTSSGLPASLGGTWLGNVSTQQQQYAAVQRPSVGHYGGAYQDSGGAGGDKILSILDQYAPVISQLSDPRVRAARKRAELEKAIARNKPTWKIRKLRHELAALEAMVNDRTDSIDEGKAWQQGITRNLWVVTGIGVAAIVLIGAGVARGGRKRRRSRK